MKIAVVGSVNLDITARAHRLPVAGETITDATLFQAPGGKGANQALAARRLGAEVTLVACVGSDSNAEAALRMLRAEGVDLSSLIVDDEDATGVALIVVAEDGENQIVVAPGANRRLPAVMLPLVDADAVVCQLEIPIAVVEEASTAAAGLFCLNAAPVRPVPDSVLTRCDLLVVNEIEYEAFAPQMALVGGLVAVTLGAAGARLIHAEREVARSTPPLVTVVDTVGAGDSFVAALVVGLLEGLEPQRALDWAVTAGALATTKPGAQPSLPFRADVELTLGMKHS